MGKRKRRFKKARRALKAACLAVGLTVASWGSSPAVDNAEAMTIAPTASYSVTIAPNHTLHDVYVGFAYYMNTSGQDVEVYQVADQISSGTIQTFSGALYGDIDWDSENSHIEYVVLGLYNVDDKLVTVGFDQNYASNSAIGYTWDTVFETSRYTSYAETNIATALKEGNTEMLAYFVTDYFDNGNQWSLNGQYSTLVKFSNGVGGGTAQATASPVPIPGAAWLLGQGLVGLILIRRRKED